MNHSLYRPLDYANFETRLLEILDTPGQGFSTIRCRMVHASLVKPPDYHALSYCWGDKSITTAIELNGQAFYVTLNLESALRELQRQGITRVWVDAISINQSDLFERSSQIARMGQIYTRAKAVIAWLGPASHSSDNAIAALNFLGPYARNHPTQSLTVEAWNAMHTGVRTIRTLFERPYWKRKWIIQEVSKAEKVHVLCGSASVTLDELLRPCVRSFGETVLPYDVRELLTGIHCFRARERPNRLGAPRMLLSEALVRTRHSLATDTRDSIYAILGLTRDGNDLVPMPNYTETTDEVMVQTSRNMVALQGQTSLILLARRNPKTICKLPSWVPNWSRLGKRLPHWIFGSLTQKREASSLSSVGLGRSTSMTENGILMVQGIHLESIVAVAGSKEYGVGPAQEVWQQLARQQSRNDTLGDQHQGWTAADVLASLWDCLTVCFNASDGIPDGLGNMTAQQKAQATAVLLKPGPAASGTLIEECYPSIRELRYCERTLKEWISVHIEAMSANECKSPPLLVRFDSDADSGYGSGSDVFATGRCQVNTLPAKDTYAMHELPKVSTGSSLLSERAAKDAIATNCTLGRPSYTFEIDRRPLPFPSNKRKYDDMRMTGNPHAQSPDTQTCKRTRTNRSMTRPEQPSNPTFTLEAQRQYLNDSLHKMSRHRMRLVVTGHGNFQVVYDKARIGDLICRLENCTLPVVLRPRHGHLLAFVGEVCVRDPKPYVWSKDNLDVRNFAIA